MNSHIENKIDKAVERLSTSGVVPLDQIFELTGWGVDFSTLDEKYNITN